METLNGIPRQVIVDPASHSEAGEMEFVQGSYAEKSSGKTFIIFFLRMKTMRNAAWTVRKVEVAGEEMWTFKGSGFSGRSQFFLVNKVPLIAEINRHHVVKQVVCLTDLGNTQVVTDGDKEIVIGGYGAKAKIIFKQEIVHQHDGLKLGLSEDEKAILTKEEVQRAEAAARIRAKEEARRKERRERILARPVMTVFSAKSEKLFGQPVTEDEWQTLAVGDKGILVDAYDDETGESGQPLEAFMVLKAKKGGKERRVRSAELFLEKPGASNTPIKVQAIMDFMVGHELAAQVPVISRDDLGKFAEKFNSGTRVALPVPDKEGKFQIYELAHGEPRTICEAEPV